ncbi:MAG: dockerin type I repeat-containing protein, partial [Ruminococcus sp.]|nr:dockerin type I repeat-containing protein [Ruminococcus sp.]
IYNGFAYKLSEDDIVSEIKDGTAYYTVKVAKKVYPDDVRSFSHVVKVYDKATKELINDAVVIGAWNIVYEEGGVTGPIAMIDTSAANPAIISFEKYKDAKVCNFSITGVMEGSPYTFSKEDYTTEDDGVQRKIYHNVYLTRSEVTYGDANSDGNVDMSDVVLIMQALSNPNKYDVDGSDDNHITAKGRTNADVWNTGDGLTTEDALHIQKYLLGLCEITGKAEMTSSPE